MRRDKVWNFAEKAVDGSVIWPPVCTLCGHIFKNKRNVFFTTPGSVAS